MNRTINHPSVGQASGLPVGGVSDSEGALCAPAPGPQRGPEPSGRRPDPRFLAKEPSRLVSGVHARGALPHLKREGASYFVTFRLAGTLPREVLLSLKRERDAIVQQAAAHNRPLTWREQKELWDWYAEKVHAWVVMPNHVHVVVHPTAPHTLSSILKSWKGYTALQANRLLNRQGTSFWQDESYDHCCRDDEDRARCCAYTRMNPLHARLCARPEDWPWSSAHVGQPVGQTSGLPVGGVSDSEGAPGTPESGPQRGPEPPGRRPDPPGVACAGPGPQRGPEPSGRRPDPRDVPGRPDLGRETP